MDDLIEVLEHSSGHVIDEAQRETLRRLGTEHEGPHQLIFGATVRVDGEHVSGIRVVAHGDGTEHFVDGNGAVLEE